MAGAMVGLKLLAVLWAVLAVSRDAAGVTWNWEKWWTYDGISGPDFWGLINLDWSLCHKGRRQSPIDIDPTRLLYDQNLRQLHIDQHTVGGLVENTGHSVVVSLDSTKNPLNVTGGPLSYRYQLSEIHLHFGSVDDMGSEHTVSGRAFPAEVQVLGFNSNLYSNFSHALDKAYGIVGISLLLKIGKSSSEAFSNLTAGAKSIRYVGTSYRVERVSVKDLLPESRYFITYEGSTTMPACHETVTWIILNKPAYITKEQLLSLREITQTNSTLQTPPRTLADNFRPPQKLNHRPVRTNIDFSNAGGNCPSMQSVARYTDGGADREEFTGSFQVTHQDVGATRGADADSKCLRCICEASSGCNVNIGCTRPYYGGYICGPFGISWLYWADAGGPRLDSDENLESELAYENCVEEFYCAVQTVKNYINKFKDGVKADCNGDGTVDCYDYILMHIGGGYSCSQEGLETDPLYTIFSACYRRK